MGFVIQVVAGKAEGRPRTGSYLACPDNAASGGLGAKTAIEGFEDVP
ncbi:hypothetical protein [Actinophytocola xanthii]|nr:hypothetical protein [Actinophytocola xanthii]